MKIAVCIKAVLRQAEDETAPRTQETCELNPFDRAALEAALALKEKCAGSVTALSMGPPACDFALFEALAMGADRAVLLSDPAFAGADTLATSRTLGAALEKLKPFDLVLFGTQTSDSDTGQVGPQTAALLGLPLVSWVNSIEPGDGSIEVERKSDGFCERYEVVLPAALTIRSGASEPRDLTLAGIERAFAESEICHWNIDDIGVSPEEVGQTGSPTVVISTQRVKRNRTCEMIQGSVREQVKELLLRLGEKGLLD